MMARQMVTKRAGADIADQDLPALVELAAHLLPEVFQRRQRHWGITQSLSVPAATLWSTGPKVPVGDQRNATALSTPTTW